MRTEKKEIFISGPPHCSGLPSEEALDVAETLLKKIENGEIQNPRAAERRVDELIFHADNSKLGERFQMATGVYMEAMSLCGVDSHSLQEGETEVLGEATTTEKKRKFIATVQAITKGMLGTEDLQEARRLLADLP